MNIFYNDSSYCVRPFIIYNFDGEHKILLKVLKPKALTPIKNYGAFDIIYTVKK